ncbi:EamA-like transporter family protein [Lutimaribacter pacificus]|uniref:EamA-like transporter family protein n=1 Tax=Lutimaribacter pacificus TaxID=391948 RepID=A0A1H0HWH7_9RHOB|nr:DMT family transporter [Lutimaribacter pacificus]SDO23529.1 EamA-like transporter family protein [Lutimaribacter pacificus]SHK30202.1 EamA-like transporter family protein [Lutimaribacter pacificus]
MSEAARGHLAMLLFSALVAGSFSLGVLVANDIAPTALNALRFALAAVIVGTVAVATHGIPRSAFRAPWRYLVLGGIFGAYFVLMFEGLKTAPAVSASAVFTLTPIIAAIAGWFLLRQVTTPRMALALLIGAAGALWVIFRADLGLLMQFHVGRGEAIYFAGCVAHAVYTPLVRLLNRGEPAVVFTFGMLLAGGLLVGIWGWSDIVATDWAALSPLVWVTLGYLAVFASSATFVLLQYATLRLPSAKVMAYTYLTPTWVVVWEFMLGHGTPPVILLGGVGLSVLALLLLLRDEG